MSWSISPQRVRRHCAMSLLRPCSPPLQRLHQTKLQHDQCPTLPERLRFWHRYASLSTPHLVAALNESILGWQRYYGMIQPHEQFQELDGYIAEGLARALAMRTPE